MSFYVGLVSTGSYDEKETTIVYVGTDFAKAEETVQHYGLTNSFWSEYVPSESVNSRWIETWSEETLINYTEIEDIKPKCFLTIDVKNHKFFIHNDELVQVIKDMNIFWLMFFGKYPSAFVE